MFIVCQDELLFKCGVCFFVKRFWAKRYRMVSKMKKGIGKFVTLMSISIAVCLLAAGAHADAAQESGKSREICNGIYAGDIGLGGMTAAEAEQAVNAYIDQLAQIPITLYASEDYSVEVTAQQLGIRWANPEILDEALGFASSGNIVKRYKEMTDLARNSQIYDIELDFDTDAIRQVVVQQSELVNVPAQNASMYRENGEFVYVPGVTGLEIDVEASVEAIYKKLTRQWSGEEETFALELRVTQPEHDTQELQAVQDMLATCTTSFATSDSSRSANVRNACNKVNGTVLYPGEEFSTLAKIAPFTEANGYYSAGSYFAGRVVDSVGGGICQVSSTLYNAVLYSELEVTYRTNHAMAVGYVKLGLDATVSEDSGIDFTFVNNTEYPIYIEGYTTPEKTITMSIYGVETRPETHRVSYESVVLQTTPPGPDAVYADAAQPIGYVDIQPAHTGYVADVYRVITENGVEVSRDQISHNTYKMTVRSATVGVSTSDPVAYDLMQAAIATGSVDHVKAVAAQIAAGNYSGVLPDQTEAPSAFEPPVQPENPTQPENPVQPEAPVQPENPVQSETSAQQEAPVESGAASAPEQ